MLPPKEIARIKADIKKLEKARDECADSGIRKQIEAWIEDHLKWKLRELS
jgi:hypothetical protein